MSKSLCVSKSNAGKSDIALDVTVEIGNAGPKYISFNLSAFSHQKFNEDENDLRT